MSLRLLGITDKIFSKHAVLNFEVPIGAWKCNFPSFFGNYDRQTDRQTDQYSRFIRVHFRTDNLGRIADAPEKATLTHE